MTKMDKSLVIVTVTGLSNPPKSNEYEKKWAIHGENLNALTDFLDWAEKQCRLEQRRTEISRRVRAKAKERQKA